MDQIIEAQEVRVVIDNRLRLLALQRQEHMVRRYEFIDQAVFFLAESNIRHALYSIWLRHRF